MKFTVDECTGTRVADWLRKLGYDVFSVYEEARGLPDEDVLKKSKEENRIIITNDKDFGNLIFRRKNEHSGVIFLRLKDERSSNKISVLEKLFSNLDSDFGQKFITVSEKSIRISS